MLDAARILDSFGTGPNLIAKAQEAGVGHVITRFSVAKWRTRGVISSKGLGALATIARRSGRRFDLAAFLAS